MPRRKGHAAEAAVEIEAFSRWRILLRKPDFQKHLNLLRRQYGEWVLGPPITHYTLDFDDPTMIFEDGTEVPRQTEGKISRREVDLYEHDCDDNDPMVGRLTGAWDDFNSQWDIKLPKVALTDGFPNLSPNTVEQWSRAGALQANLVQAPVRARHSWGTWWELEVNLGYPLDVLLETIKKELTKATEGGRGRRRRDKLDYYLQVYDRAKLGERFSVIAHGLKKKVSTIKSAYLAIGRMIVSFDPKAQPKMPSRHNQAPPAKNQVALLDFDPTTHMAQCRQCSEAETFDAMCEVAKAYSEQEVRGQRELPLAHLGAFGDEEVDWS